MFRLSAGGEGEPQKIGRKFLGLHARVREHVRGASQRNRSARFSSEMARARRVRSGFEQSLISPRHEEEKPAQAGCDVKGRREVSQLLGSREGFERRGDAWKAAAPGSRYVTESLSLRHSVFCMAPLYAANLFARHWIWHDLRWNEGPEVAAPFK